MRLFVSVLLVLALLSATTATALMATITQVFGGGVNGLVTCAYAYDDQTNVITSIILTNNDSLEHTVTGQALNPNTFAVIVSRTVRATAHSVQTYDVSGLGVQMITVTGKFGSFLAPPVVLSCAVS